MQKRSKKPSTASRSVKQAKTQLTQRQSPTHDLFNYMQQTTEEMAKQYEQIQRRSREDPGTAGDQGEENWATLFREWLPKYFPVVTKGRILSDDGKASPQVDLLILSPSYPEKLWHQKYYLAGGVAAAFECKVTLNAKHIREAVEHCLSIKRLLPKQHGSPYKELQAPLIFGLLAHSHSWKSPGSSPTKNINEKLAANDARLVSHPREMLDLLCVSDLAAWLCFKWPCIGQSLKARGYDIDPTATTTFVEHSHTSHSQRSGFTSTGAFLSHLFNCLAWEYPDMRRLSRYLTLTRLQGAGVGKSREWPLDIYSEHTRKRIEAGALDKNLWSEWSMRPFP